MKFIVSKEDKSVELVDAADIENAIANVPGGVSARLAQYIDKRRFGLIDKEKKESSDK